MAQLNESHGRIKAPPRTGDVQVLRNYVADLADMLAKLAKDLDFIINGNLDVKNIRANSITADRMDVTELSAISANLGEITAGIIRGIEIYGSYIATSEGGFPRTEMSTTDNYFKVWLNATTYIEIIDFGEEGLPQINLYRDEKQVKLGHGVHSMPSGDFPGLVANTQFTISSSPNLMILSRVELINWSNLVNLFSGRNLQQELQDIKDSLDSLTAAISNKAEKSANTSSAGSHNHGIPDGTVLMTSTGTVTFHASGGHSHTQN